MGILVVIVIALVGSLNALFYTCLGVVVEFIMMSIVTENTGLGAQNMFTV